MNITPTHRRIALFVFVALAAFGGGGALGEHLAKPEVITVSKDVPTACTDAVDAGFDGIAAERKVEESLAKANELAVGLSLSILISDAEKIDKALRPIAEHNEDESEWRIKRDDARRAFTDAANECLGKAAAAEAVNDR